jgi:alkyl sulfatase BDS1-like metallo-beta-lactamase superfamily hydrolase
MNRGDDVWSAMRNIVLPDHLDLGQAYGRVDWSVRAIWEGYGGWFHQRSTLELYPVPPEHGWREIVELAGGADAVAARAAKLIDGAADEESLLAAVRLCEMALASDEGNRSALHTYLAAHEGLATRHDRANFWLTNWLDGEISGTRNRLERTQQA